MFNQILSASNIRNIWRTVRRICLWTLGLEGLTLCRGSVLWHLKARLSLTSTLYLILTFPYYRKEIINSSQLLVIIFPLNMDFGVLGLKKG